MANVLYGMPNTHKINLQTMINQSKAVKSGAKNSFLVVDMPKGSYDNAKLAKKNAKKIINETKCDAIKIESNNKNFSIIGSLVEEKINVMGHIGFTPQFKKKFKIEGLKLKDQKRLIKEAKLIERAGAFSIILECISRTASEKITKSIGIPTIGIGSSSNCDGQILVTDDMLGLSGFYPKFVKKYANMEKLLKKEESHFQML